MRMRAAAGINAPTRARRICRCNHAQRYGTIRYDTIRYDTVASPPSSPPPSQKLHTVIRGGRGRLCCDCRDRSCGGGGGGSGGGGGGEVATMEIDARFRYYFQHPWSRMFVAYLVTFCNFLIFAEDPVSHSQTQAHMTVVGNCFSFLFNKYPGGGWNAMKVVCWILAIITGLLAGKFIFHRRLFSGYLRLKMFREDHGSWMTMFFSTILFLFIFSNIYNLFLLMAGDMG
ncbi:unnamed protein product [Merluccius merluccius]